MNTRIKIPRKVKEALDKAKDVGYTKYSMCNFTGMISDFPDMYAVLHDYFFSNHETYLKAVLFDNYYSDIEPNVFDNEQGVKFCSKCKGSVWQNKHESKYCFRCGSELNW